MRSDWRKSDWKVCSVTPFLLIVFVWPITVYAQVLGDHCSEKIEPTNCQLSAIETATIRSAGTSIDQKVPEEPGITPTSQSQLTAELSGSITTITNRARLGVISFTSKHEHTSGASETESTFFPAMFPGMLAYPVGSPKGKNMGATSEIYLSAYVNNSSVDETNLKFKHLGLGKLLNHKLKSEPGVPTDTTFQIYAKSRTHVKVTIRVDYADAEAGLYPLALYMEEPAPMGVGVVDVFKTYVYVFLQN